MASFRTPHRSTPHEGREDDTGRFVSPISRVVKRYIDEEATPDGKRFKCNFEDEDRNCGVTFGHARSAYKHVRDKHPATLQPVPLDLGFLNELDYPMSNGDDDRTLAADPPSGLPAPPIEDEVTSHNESAESTRATATPDYDMALSAYLRQIGASDKDTHGLLELLRLGVPADFDFDAARIIARNRSRVKTIVFCQTCQSELASGADNCRCANGGSYKLVLA